MGKYTSVTKGIRIQNQNQPNERVILSAPEERYFFDCTWERTAFVGQGERQSYRDENGKTRFFFKLVEEISGLDSFNSFEGMTVVAFDTVPIEGKQRDSFSDSIDAVVKAFSDRFLDDSHSTLPGTSEDVGIILDRREGNFQMQVQYGPFRPEKDVEGRDLVIFGQPGGSLQPDWAVAPSLLIRTRIGYAGADIDHDTFLECDAKRREIVAQIAESSKSLLTDGG
jgi:hypothetical protein